MELNLPPLKCGLDLVVLQIECGRNAGVTLLTLDPERHSNFLLALSLGSLALEEDSCHAVRTLKQFMKEVLMLGN